MSQPVVAMTADMTVAAAREALTSHGIHGAPVVDDDDRPVGMVSLGDLYRATERDPAANHRRLSEVMVCFAFTLPARASLGQVAALMAYEGVHRIVITDDFGRVVGIVSALDVAAWVGQQAGYVGFGRQ
jgi:CBS domain-containing protein